MGIMDLKFNPEYKKDYVLTLNNGIGHRRNLSLYCQKHRCFVTQKQCNSGNRHCLSPSKDGSLPHCSYCVFITDENWEELKKQSALEEKIKELSY